MTEAAIPTLPRPPRDAQGRKTALATVLGEAVQKELASA